MSGDSGRVGASSSVSASVPRAIVAAVRAGGHDVAALLSRVGLHESELADVRARIPAVAVAKLWHEAPRLVGDEAFGITIGSTSAEALSLGAYLLRSCATVGEGLAQIWQYYRVFNDVHGVDMHVGDDGRIALRLATNDQPIQVPRHAIEFAFSWLLSMVRMTTGRELSPLSVAFEHAAPSSVEPHAKLFRCPVAFGKSHSEFVFPATWLELPQLTVDPHLREIVELAAKAELDRLPASATIAMRTRVIVAPMLGSDAASLLELVATRLHVGARTLQRQLKEEGTSFQRELDDLRRQFAEKRLRDGSASLAEIAHAVGFADQSAFHKAFLRWTGKTPGEFRKGA